MAPYLIAADIATRLSQRFSVTATITPGDADIATEDLDASGPFIGERLADGQERAFPRDKNPDGTPNTSNAVPTAILDWVSLRAYQLSIDEDPPVQSEGAGRVSVTYALPKISQTEKRKARLLEPYLKHEGGFGTLGVASSFDPAPVFRDFEDRRDLNQWPMTEVP